MCAVIYYEVLFHTVKVHDKVHCIIKKAHSLLYNSGKYEKIYQNYQII